jgi:hypothetical protein
MPTQVALPILMPILEAGANEEDERMSDRWAALLANAAGWPGRVPPRFPSILSELSPPEAALLDAIFVEAHSGGGAPWESHVVKVLELESPLDAEQRAVAMDTLIALGLCFAQQITAPGVISENREVVYLTTLGRAFVRECRAPLERPG